MFKKIAALLSPEGSGYAATPRSVRPAPAGKFAVYLTDSEANTLRMILSKGASALQASRKVDAEIAKILYDLSDKDNKDDPKVSLAYKLLNIAKGKIRKSRAMEKRVNGIIRAIRQRQPV